MAPLRHPEYYQYEFNADVTQVWTRGSVVTSWLLDLTAQALASDSEVAEFEGKVADSGEGRETVAANNAGVPAHVLTGPLSSRGHDVSRNKVLSTV